MNFLPSTMLVALLCLFFATITTPLTAQTAKVKKIPFHGKLASVDTSAQTITIAGKKENRVFHLTPTTKIIDGAGNPSSLAAATAGEDVGGSYAKSADGTMALFSVRFGAKEGSAKSEAAERASVATAPPVSSSKHSVAAAAAPATAAAATTPAASAPEKKKRFSGKVTSVDAASGTLVVHGMTLTTTGETKITDSTGAAIGLSGLAAGDKVSGSYMASADGKTMTASSVKTSK